VVNAFSGNYWCNNADTSVAVLTLDAFAPAYFSSAYGSFFRALRTSRANVSTEKAALNGPPHRSSAESESETPLELNQSRGSIASEKRAQDASWSVDRADDRAKVRVGDIAYGLVKVGVVE
jgi:hypothetical protein